MYIYTHIYIIYIYICARYRTTWETSSPPEPNVAVGPALPGALAGRGTSCSTWQVFHSFNTKKNAPKWARYCRPIVVNTCRHSVLGCFGGTSYFRKHPYAIYKNMARAIFIIIILACFGHRMEVCPFSGPYQTIQFWRQTL